MIGLGKRPKSKLPEPSTNMKNTGKQDYMSEAMNAPHTKLDASPQQPPMSAKDQNPTSFKRVTMGIKRGTNSTATKKKNNNGVNVY